MPEPDNLKSILRLFTYGLYVVTSLGAEGPRAATISWAMQVSFEPKLIVVGMRKGTAICEAVQHCRQFVLHIVGEHQAEFAKAFFRMGQIGSDAIAGYRYGLSARGLPIFGAAVAWLECEVVEEAGQAGDHVLFVARLLDGDVQMPASSPLVLCETNWHYGG